MQAFGRHLALAQTGDGPAVQQTGRLLKHITDTSPGGRPTQNGDEANGHVTTVSTHVGLVSSHNTPPSAGGVTTGRSAPQAASAVANKNASRDGFMREV
jgi:hypothetical protein